jgi:hypothetical protein
LFGHPVGWNEVGRERQPLRGQQLRRFRTG